MQWKIALPKICSNTSASPKNSLMKLCSQLAVSISSEANDRKTAS